mmetsp:Transcript_2025/g.4470  ORF Transcript_2025/g.4470 Transcript_2025/m.4470 type:complete len:213 (-) Transcript_2025:418-1056(-)
MRHNTITTTTIATGSLFRTIVFSVVVQRCRRCSVCVAVGPSVNQLRTKLYRRRCHGRDRHFHAHRGAVQNQRRNFRLLLNVHRIVQRIRRCVVVAVLILALVAVVVFSPPFNPNRNRHELNSCCSTTTVVFTSALRLRWSKNRRAFKTELRKFDKQRMRRTGVERGAVLFDNLLCERHDFLAANKIKQVKHGRYEKRVLAAVLLKQLRDRPQ